MPLARRPVLPGLTAIAAAAGGVAALTRLTRYYSGPVSDHFDGLRFFDPHGSAPKSFTELLRWQLGKKPVAWPRLDPSPYRDVPPPRVDNPRVHWACEPAVAGGGPEHPARSGVVAAR